MLSPSLLLSPGLTNESVVLVRVPVDMSRAENQPGAAQQDLDDGEDIEILRCTLSRLLPQLDEWQQQSRVQVFAGLYTLALGMAMGGGGGGAAPLSRL